MRIYEELFIVRPDATDEEIDPLVEQLTSVITAKGGTIDKTDKWGVRKLAYRVQKRTEGYYILIQFTAGPETVKELERRLRVADMVMKFITVRIDERLKKIEKRRKSREKRAARRPAPPVVQPSLPMFAEPPVGGGPMPGAPMPGAPMPTAPVAEGGETTPVVHAAVEAPSPATEAVPVTAETHEAPVAAEKEQ